MTVNVEVQKQSNESTTSLIRRFTKRVQGSGVLRRSRKIRYFARPASKYVKKKQALKLIERRTEYEELAKLGKLPEETRTRRSS
jgi:ribosomal protein S21